MAQLYMSYLICFINLFLKPSKRHRDGVVLLVTGSEKYEFSVSDALICNKKKKVHKNVVSTYT